MPDMIDETSNKNDIKILFLEDDLFDRLSIQRSFEKMMHYEIEIVESLSEALKAHAEKCFDIIVTDYFLKDGTGLDLINKITDTPIIFITGSEDVKPAIKAMKAGARDYLVKDISGQYLKLIPIIVDRIIKDINNENVLQDAEIEKQNALIEKEKYLSILSHEIRNPINSLLGIIDTLKRKSHNKEQLDSIENLEYLGDHILILINDVLNYEKIQNTDIFLVPARFSLQKLVELAHHNFQSKALSKNISFQIILNPDVPKEVFGDKTRTQQVITNLIDNAIKFTQSGEVELNISLQRKSRSKVTVRFIVSDTGIGISPQDIKGIFKPFVRGSVVSEMIGGTGLGLSIVEKIVNLANGKIDVKSLPGKGSKFIVDLPYELLANKEKKDAVGILNHDSILVLYVEDMESNQFIMKELFKQWGIRLDIASNGAEAMELVKSKNYKLILMDIEMPGANGLEISMKIRKLKKNIFREIPIIAISGKNKEEIVEKSEISGIDDFIQKPINPEILYHKMKSILQQ